MLGSLLLTNSAMDNIPYMFIAKCQVSLKVGFIKLTINLPKSNLFIKLNLDEYDGGEHNTCTPN
jgi:hypothetical protein